MPISKQWPSGGTNPVVTSYNIPLNNELNWTQLSSFLQALADSAQGTSFQKFAARVAVTSPIAVSATTDCVVVSNLTVAGPVAVTLPAGAAKQVFIIVDGKGDAGTNNITITPNGAETIKGAATLVLSSNYTGVVLVFTGTNWDCFGPFLAPGQVTPADFVGILPTTKGGTGVNGTATFPTSGTVAVVPASGVVKSNGTVLSVSNVDLTTEVTGVLPNANTTATATNTASAIVSRNGSGDFAAGIITASLTGNATNITATTNATLTTLSALSLPGAQVTGNIAGNAANITATTNSTITTLSSLSLPGSQVTGNIAGNAANVTGTVAIGNGGTGQITANAGLNALLPTQTSSANKFLRTDGTNTAWASATGGAGEINAVLNSSGSDGTTGWTGTTVVSGASSPLNPIVTTAFSILNAATPQTSTTGGYYPFTMPSGLMNKKLKVEFTFTSPATDVYQVSVYTGSTRVPLTTDASGVTALPAGTTGKFTSYFDSDNSTSWTVGVTRISGSTGAVIITNVIVGPGIQPQGAVVGEWQSYTPTVSNLGTSVSGSGGRWRRVSTVMEITGYWNNTGAGSGSSTVTVSLPSGYTIDFTALPWGGGGNRILLGNGAVYNGSSFVDTDVALSTSTTFSFLKTGSAISFTGADLASNSEVSWNIQVPIAEWAGSGTVNLAQNDVEYAYSTNTVTTAGNVQSDDGLYGYGPDGTQFVAINNTTLSSATTKRVRFQTPRQVGDVYDVEIFSSGGWAPLVAGGGLASNFRVDGTAFYGIGFEPVAGSNTDLYVAFGNAGRTGGTSGGFGSVNSNAVWANIAGNSAYKWRVRKSSAGAAVGFGIVVPGTSSGLVSASGLPGRTDGGTVATGYVGEILSATSSTKTPNVQDAWHDFTNNSVTLTPGQWELTGTVVFDNSGSSPSYQLYWGAWCTTAGNNTTTLPTLLTPTAGANNIQINMGSQAFSKHFLVMSSVVHRVNTNTTIYLNANSNQASGANARVTCYIVAKRIA